MKNDVIADILHCGSEHDHNFGSYEDIMPATLIITNNSSSTELAHHIFLISYVSCEGIAEEYFVAEGHLLFVIDAIIC